MRGSGKQRRRNALAPGLGALIMATAISGEAQELERPRYLIADESKPSDSASLELPLVLRRDLRPNARAPQDRVVSWLSVLGGVLPAQTTVPAGGIRLWGKSPGKYQLARKQTAQLWVALGVGAVDSGGHLTSRAAISRSLPPELRLGQGQEKEEARSFVLMGPSEHLPSSVSLVSTDEKGDFLDSSRALPLTASPCPPEWAAWEREGENTCVSTPRVRFAADSVERNHPAIQQRTLLGVVGGEVKLRLDEGASFSLPVGAPLELGFVKTGTEKGGPGEPQVARHRARVRARIVRTFPGGPPAIGADDEDAKRIVRAEISATSRMWGQCGIALGAAEEIDVQVVDPPKLSSLTIGCGRGLPAGGGVVKFQAGGRRVALRTRKGERPRSVALRLASELRRGGLNVSVLRNARTARSAFESYDLIVTDKKERPVPIKGSDVGLTNDPSLSVCEGQLDLADGLDHFTDENAAAGTLEERYLLRALSDDDPSTIELIVVPVFGGVGRIGESFIYTPGGSVESALILDRTGIRAGARSLTLAHELGHILLELPGHPDDFGVDTPSSLMDSDAADATIFGPRHLSLEDCRRALLQSGKGAPVPLLEAWPLD